MENIKNKKNMVQTVLFASLIATMILPFGIMSASAQTQTSEIYDPVMVQYLQDITYMSGTTTETKIIDGDEYAVTTKVKEVSDSEYNVISITAKNNVVMATETFEVTDNNNNTYRLVNEDLGIDAVFTNVSQGAAGAGSGYSSANGASIHLYDREFGTPHTLLLYDRYHGCSTFNAAEIQATIRPNTIDVTWEASPFYLHWCLVPQEFMDGSIKSGTSHYFLDSQSDRRSSHAFNNPSGGATWYSVSADFRYGSW